MGLEVATTFGVTAPSTPFTVKAGERWTSISWCRPWAAPLTVWRSCRLGSERGGHATFTPPTVVPGASGATTVLTNQTAAPIDGIPAHRGVPIRTDQPGGRLVCDGRTAETLARSLLILLMIATLVGTTFMLTGCTGDFGTSPVALGYGHRHQRVPACFHHVHPDCEVRGKPLSNLRAQQTTGQMADKDK